MFVPLLKVQEQCPKKIYKWNPYKKRKRGRTWRSWNEGIRNFSQKYPEKSCDTHELASISLRILLGTKMVYAERIKSIVSVIDLVLVNVALGIGFKFGDTLNDSNPRRIFAEFQRSLTSTWIIEVFVIGSTLISF